tara:strand:- start:2183 stop:3253 length:1071 start_codon:yes stop_codon:yes gene_type:complete
MRLFREKTALHYIKLIISNARKARELLIYYRDGSKTQVMTPEYLDAEIKRVISFLKTIQKFDIQEFKKIKEETHSEELMNECKSIYSICSKAIELLERDPVSESDLKNAVYLLERILDLERIEYAQERKLEKNDYGRLKFLSEKIKGEMKSNMDLEEFFETVEEYCNIKFGPNWKSSIREKIDLKDKYLESDKALLKGFDKKMTYEDEYEERYFKLMRGIHLFNHGTPENIRDILNRGLEPSNAENPGVSGYWVVSDSHPIFVSPRAFAVAIIIDVGKLPFRKAFPYRWDLGDPTDMMNHPTIQCLIERKAFLALYQQDYRGPLSKELIADVVLYTKKKKELLPIFYDQDLAWPRL